MALGRVPRCIAAARYGNNRAILRAYFDSMPSLSEHEQLTIRPMVASDAGVYFGAMPNMSEHERLTTRLMAAGDAAVIAEMARELAAALDDPGPALDPDDLARDGMGPERWFDCLVAEVDGRLIGYAMVCRGYEAHIGKRRLWLSDLYVRTEARRSGAGRALMAAAARLAIAQGCEAVYWDLWRLNRVGKAFYESLGAVEDGDLAIWRGASRQLAAPSENDSRR